jgi:hypothetical protein
MFAAERVLGAQVVCLDRALLFVVEHLDEAVRPGEEQPFLGGMDVERFDVRFRLVVGEEAQRRGGGGRHLLSFFREQHINGPRLVFSIEL